MIVYGKNVFNQIKEDPQQIQEVYVLNNIKDQSVLKAVRQLKCPVKTVSRKELEKMTDQGIHNGIAAKVKDIPTYTLDELLQRKKGDRPGLYVALDNIQDPHNVGSILRSADCTGVDGVILCKHNSAGLTPTAIKASTGAAYTVPVAIVLPGIKTNEGSRLLGGRRRYGQRPRLSRRYVRLPDRACDRVRRKRHFTAGQKAMRLYGQTADGWLDFLPERFGCLRRAPLRNFESAPAGQEVVV